MILCGAAHTGKSTAAKVMIDILTQMQQQHQTSSNGSSKKDSPSMSEAQYSIDGSAQTHKIYR